MGGCLSTKACLLVQYILIMNYYLINYEKKNA